MFRKKKSAPSKKGNEGDTRKRPPMGMFGMFGEEDDVMGGATDDSAFEAELNQLLGGGGGKKKTAPSKSKQLMDWSDLDAQISASMKDVDDDDDFEAEEEGDLEAELEGLVEDDEDGLQPPAPNKRRSPSPQPQASGGSQLQLLQERKTNYDTAIKNAQANGEGSKARRYQRGMKTLEDMLKKAKAGKPINEQDIPPQIATGKPPTSEPVAPPTQASATDPTPSSPPSINVTAPMGGGSPTKAPPTPPRPASSPKPVVTETPEPAQKSGDPKLIEMLVHKQQEFKKAALTAKQAGNKEDAIKYFRIIKQFDAVIAAAKEGQPVDLSKMPSPPGQASSPKQAAPVQQPPQPEPAPVQAATSQPSTQQSIPVPKTLLEGLAQRQQKYKSSADQAKAEGNGSKSRRMMRIVKQYDDAIRSHKAGKTFNITELPVPVGYPPLPGMNEKPQDISDVLQQAGNIQLDVDGSENTEPQVVQAALAATAVRQPARPPPSPNQIQAPKSPSRSPSPRRAQPKQSAYQQQIEFLVNRQAKFKEAALEAKKKGDKDTAVEMLRKMKGFEPMIEQARNGMRIDITKVPLPPIVQASGSKPQNDDEFEVLGDGKMHEDDGQIYKTLLETLQEQIKKARGYSEQFTHSGDVNGANMFDHLSTDSQRDYDFVKNLKRHGDAPPRYYLENKTFESVHIIPELNTGELELIIVQLLDVDGSAKDLKPFVEWELPFPHDNPIKGKTEEVKMTNNLRFDAQFRIPINRKNKGFQRAIKNKAVKFEAIQKGGFLRSDKSLGSASVKLGPLETTCEIRAVEPLREGRAVIGRIEVKIRMRTPLIGSESQTITEKWLVVSHEQVARRPAPRPSQGRVPSASASSQKRSSPKKEAGHPKLQGSVEVLSLEKRMVDAKIRDLQSKGQRPPTSVLQNQQSIQSKLVVTQKFLKDGGIEAKKAYVLFLKSEIGNLTKEAQMNVKQGKHDQAKYSLTKRKMVEKELLKLAPANTYL